MAYDFESNGFYYNIISLSDLTAELTCSGAEDEYNETATYSGDITIPQTAEYANKTFRVIGINPYAFINCSIGTLTIPKTIESVGGNIDGWNRGLFGNFMNLVIEDSDEPLMCYRSVIEGNVFNSVYLGREIDGDSGCSIVYDSWSGSGGSYKTITFGDKLTRIPYRCCYYCQNLTEITLPVNVKAIDSEAFSGCSSLASINLENIEEIGTHAFSECSSLKTVNASIEVLKDGTFLNCSALESFDFPKLRIIEYRPFANCTSLKNVVLPSGVVGIYGDEYGGAFDGCTSLESITIPSTIVKIGNASEWEDENTKTFVGCTSLKTISIANPSPIQLAESNFDMLTYLSATLKVPVGAKEAYSKAAGWKNFSIIEEDASLEGDIYTVFYDERDSYYDGSLEIDFEDALDAFEYVDEYGDKLGKYRFAAEGSTITINVKPNRDYKLESLIVNGEDVTANVESNVYSFVVTGSVTISASFEYDDNPEPEVPIFLSIKQADGGCVKMRVNKWYSYGFIIEPTEGWRVHSVTFNGVDVTDYVYEDGTFYTPDITDNSEMVVAFETIDNSIEHRSASQARVTASSGNVIVTGANPAEEILICNESGVVVANTIGNGTNQTFPMPDTGIYIVKVGGKTVKISL